MNVVFDKTNVSDRLLRVGCSMNELLPMIQSNTDTILYVKNNTTLHIFTESLDVKYLYHVLDKYCFVSKSFKKNYYVVYGRKNAVIFYPKLEEEITDSIILVDNDVISVLQIPESNIITEEVICCL
jgi:hypothetical protein